MNNFADSQEDLSEENERLRHEVERLEAIIHSLSAPSVDRQDAEFHSWADVAPIGVFMLSGDRIIYQNATLARLFGVKAEDLQKQPCWDLVHLEATELVKHRYVQRQAGRDVPTVVVAKSIDANGKTIWVEVYETRYRFRNTDVILGFVVDVTGLKEAEQLQAVEAGKYSSLIESAGEAIFTIDRQGIFLFMNGEAASQLGGTPGDFAGKTLWEVFPELLAERQSVAIQSVFDTGKPFSREVPTVLQGQDHIHHTTGVPVLNAMGQITSVLCVARDVTELRSAQRALIESDQMFRALAETAPAVIVIVQGEETVFANQMAMRNTALQSPDLSKVNFWDFIAPDFRDKVREIGLARRRGEKVPESYEVKVMTAQREIKWALFSGKEIVYKGKLATIVVALDITELKRLDEEFKAAHNKLRAIVENTSDCILLSDETDSPVYFNSAYARIMKEMLDIEMVPGLKPHTLLPDLKERAFWAECHRRVLLGERFTEESVFRPECGPARHFEHSFYPIIESGSVKGFSEVTREVTDRKQAEITLRESEELFRAVADTAPVAIVINQGDNMVYANRFALNAVGRTSSDLGKKNFWEFVHPDHQQIVRNIAQARQRGEAVPSMYEVKIVGHSGEERWALLSGSLINHNGKPASLGIAVDITERKRAEETLRLLAHRLSVATESANIGIWDLDLKTNHLVWDNRMYQIYRISESDFGGAFETWQRSVHPDDLDRASREVSEAISSTGGFHTSFRIVVPDGQVRHIEAHASVLRTPDGKPDLMVGVNLDVTERKLVEEEVKESEEKFRRITERSFDAIYHIDVDGMLTYASPAAERLAGYRPDDVIGRHASEFITEKYLPAVGRALAITATGRVVESLQFEIIASDGHPVFVEANATPIIHNDRVVATQTIVRDISARRQAEQMLEQAYEEQSRQLRQVAGGLAHEIYNNLFPLTAAVHKLRQHLDRPDDPAHERNLRLLQLMDEAVSRAIELTETVSLYSKLQHDSAGTSTRVRKVLDAVLEYHQKRIDLLGLKAVVEVPDVLEVACSERNLNSLLMNLLLNALDAMAGTQQPSLSITARRINGKVEITFGDNGLGITPDVLPRVFDPFFSTKPNTGTGLGLAIVKRVVDVCGGEIKVNSAVDIGTTFHIFLPGDVGT